MAHFSGDVCTVARIYRGRRLRGLSPKAKLDWRLVLFGRRIAMQFEPHRIEDGETAGKTNAQNPREIPHVVAPFSVYAVRFTDLSQRHAPAHDVKDPACVQDDNGQEKERGGEHEF